MPREVLVRSTLEEDLPAITAIYAEAVVSGTGSFEFDVPSVALMTRRWRNRVDKALPHLVATRDGCVVGCSYASRYRTSPAYAPLVEDSIFVAAAAHGQGVGRALLTELIGRCDALDFRQMIALIASANLASVRLHERLGFRRIGVIEGSAFKHGEWIDTVLMQRALGEADRTPPHAGG